MAGTIKTQLELEALLADNTTKQISAQDVRTIVTSNYQPQMVYHGVMWNGNNNNDGGMRVLYYNPNFFYPQVPTDMQNSENIWQVTNTGNGLANGTYENVTITPSAPIQTTGASAPSDLAKPIDAYGTRAKCVVANGNLTSLEITSQGTGWYFPDNSPTSSYMTGVIEIPGSGTKPTLRYNGPIRVNDSTGTTVIYRCTTNPTAQGSQAQADFTLMNTCCQAYSFISSAGNGIYFRSTNAQPANYFLVQTDGDKNLHITLWRVAANV